MVFCNVICLIPLYQQWRAYLMDRLPSIQAQKALRRLTWRQPWFNWPGLKWHPTARSGWRLYPRRLRICPAASFPNPGVGKVKSLTRQFAGNKKTGSQLPGFRLLNSGWITCSSSMRSNRHTRRSCRAIVQCAGADCTLPGDPNGSGNRF